MRIQDAKDVILRHLQIEGGDEAAVLIATSGYISVDSCTVRNCAYGIFACYGSDYGVISNCIIDYADTVHHDFESPAAIGYGTYNADLIKLYEGASYWKVHHNTLAGAPHTAICLQGYTADPTGRVSHNEVYQNALRGGVDYSRPFETLSPNNILGHAPSTGSTGTTRTASQNGRSSWGTITTSFTT